MPALAVLVAIDVLPMLWSIGISFFRFRADRPHTPPRFVGLGNYVFHLLSEDVWEHAQNTAILMGASVLLQVVLGSLLALLFHRPFPGRRPVLMLVLTPMLLSTVAVGTFFNFFYDPTFGFISAVLRPVLGHPFVPLATPASAMLSLIIADAWMWSPFVMLMLLAGLESIPPGLLEAAQIDRASTWMRFRAVIFPSIRGVLLLAVLFRMIESFNQFDLVYTITNGGPGTSTETLSTEVYDQAFVLFETSRASALANLGTFVIIVLVRLYFQALRERDPAQAQAWETARTAAAGPRPVLVLSRPARAAVVGVAMPLAALLLVGVPYLLRHFRAFPRLLIVPPAPGTAAAVQGWPDLETTLVAPAAFPARREGIGWITAPATCTGDLDADAAPPLQPGVAAELHAPGLAGRTFAARVDRVAPAAAGRIRLHLAVTDPEGALQAGALVQFRLTGASAAVTLLAVPVGAVMYENDGARVWVVGADGVPVPRPVRIGRIAGGMAQIVEGVDVGETVVVAGAPFLDRAWKGY